ncbi:MULTISPECIES: 5,6-dimethylbenzimidazole synthase [Rhodomicrobium]|uniref:5,6-dimethylbenzimidazole synthase n=1 Tax=Rhodomicrobium TaxID=1068 RepID=UPI000B4ABD22|nr:MULTISPECIES: 5,6-dimethylbenzimidazole synthase [Rhodomicrobium]
MQFSAEFAAEFEQLLRWRRDVRHFRKEPVPEDLFRHILATACLAPSVGLSQPWRFVRVDEPGRRLAVRDVFRRCNAAALSAQAPDKAGLYARLKLAGLDDAPIQLAVYAESEPAQGSGLGRATMPETVHYSVVTAVHTLWLCARVHGIGVGWVSIIEPEAVTAILDVPQAWRLIAYLCIGYPDGPADEPLLQRAGWEKRCDPAALILAR